MLKEQCRESSKEFEGAKFKAEGSKGGGLSESVREPTYCQISYWLDSSLFLLLCKYLIKNK